MVTEPPRSRYRVVEKGRTLVVIDTLTNAPVAGRGPVGRPAAIPRLPSAPQRTDFAGRATLVTHPLYDDRAPRTLQLDEGATQLVDGVRVVAVGGMVMFAVAAAFLPWLLLAPAALFNPRVRAALRAPVTRWLDRYDAGASAG